MPPSSARARIKSEVLAVVLDIPEGRVTTYGAIGKHLGVTARQAAYVLARLTPEESSSVPWYRVVASKGVVSTMKLGAVGRRQVARLQAEGVDVTPRHKVADFASVFWVPDTKTAAARRTRTGTGSRR
ncbi:MAG TPA: MGMT family protein [Fimbriiglobus sp.]|nr:MGMT family protein [Fimbriiglobus sp.]